MNTSTVTPRLPRYVGQGLAIVITATALSSCVAPLPPLPPPVRPVGYVEPVPVAYGAWGIWDTVPVGYVGETYVIDGRHYYGGHHEMGSFNYAGHHYTSRYLVNGRAYYGGHLVHHGDREEHAPHPSHRRY
jgi:hypothetical protein